MKTKHFLLSGLLVCVLIKILAQAPGKTTISITDNNAKTSVIELTDAQSSALDFARTAFNAERASDTNFVAVTSAQYLNNRMLDVVNSWKQGFDAKRAAAVVDKFQSADEAKKIAIEAAAIK